jgi:hypothetical protein
MSVALGHANRAPTSRPAVVSGTTPKPPQPAPNRVGRAHSKLLLHPPVDLPSSIALHWSSSRHAGWSPPWRSLATGTAAQFERRLAIRSTYGPRPRRRESLPVRAIVSVPSCGRFRSGAWIRAMVARWSRQARRESRHSSAWLSIAASKTANGGSAGSSRARRRRNRTFQAVGCTALLALKARRATRPLPPRRKPTARCRAAARAGRRGGRSPWWRPGARGRPARTCERSRARRGAPAA